MEGNKNEQKKEKKGNDEVKMKEWKPLSVRLLDDEYDELVKELEKQERRDLVEISPLRGNPFFSLL